ncbi:MAG: sigma-70 family RNA polymerase sigma factor [Phycisphaerales bacterium]|nr:sigma-70 family RNA polymerase sigma factor [Phycisphaerales bacterium]
MMIDDWELLRRWVGGRDEVAFGELVGRHVGMVYGSAVRMLGRTRGAEDVVQAVFLLLVQRAGRMRKTEGVVTLAGWLYRVTGYCVRNVRKQEGRRTRREREAAMMRCESLEEAMEREAMMGVLDEALGRLGEKERVAILVRYLEGKTVAETGRMLGISTEAAEKRLERGVGKLRGVFARKGFSQSASGVVASLCAEGAKGVPAGVTSGVMAVGVGEVGVTVLGIAKGAAMAMKMVAMMKVVGGVVAVVLMMVGVVLAQEIGKSPIAVGKETTAITEPLHADGTPDYLAALNARLSKGVTPENNAFVAWLGVMGTARLPEKTRAQMLKMCGAKEAKSQWVDYGSILKRDVAEDAWNATIENEWTAMQRLWDAKDFPVMAEWLKENAAALDKTREAFSRSRYWLPYVAGDGRSMIAIFVPSLALMKEAASGLCARATFRAKAGDFDGFMSDVMAAKHMARRINQSGTLIEHLVGVAIDAMADRSIVTVATAEILSAKQYAELAKAIEALKPLPQVRETIDVYERWTTLDNVVLLATGKLLAAGKEASFFVPDNPDDPSHALSDLDRTWVDWNVVMKRTNQWYDTQVSILKNPDLGEVEREMKRISDSWKSPEAMAAGWAKRRDGETREAYTQRVGDGINILFYGILGKAEVLYRRNLMQHEMAKAVLAAGRYRVEKGKYPEKLEVLVPGYLKELPRDIYSGKAVLYAQSEKGIRVYSVGENRYDDGGIRGKLKDGRTVDDIVVGVEVDAGSR